MRGFIILLLLAQSLCSVSEWTRTLLTVELTSLLPCSDGNFIAIGNTSTTLSATKYGPRGGTLLSSNYLFSDPFVLLSSLPVEDEGILVLGKVSTTGSRWIPFAVKLNAGLRKLWKRTYPAIAQTVSLAHDMAYLTEGTGRYVISGRVADRAVFLEGIDTEGIPVWNSTVEAPESISAVQLARTRGSEVAVAAVCDSGSYLFTFTSSGTLKYTKTLSGMIVESIAELANSTGLVVVSRSQSDSVGWTDIFVSKLASADKTTIWTRKVFSTLAMPSRHRLIPAPDGRLLLFGGLRNEANTTGILLGLYRNGTVRWRHSLSDLRRVRDAVQLSPRQIVFVAYRKRTRTSQTLSGFLLPRSISTLAAGRTESGDCALGLYWNGSACGVCPGECMSCDDGSTCTECFENYVADEDSGMCVPVPCNCSSAKLTPECAHNCTGIQICAVGVSIAEQLPTNGTCVCPSRSVNNGSHCVSVVSEGCPVLCDYCAQGKCTQCRRSHRVQTVALSDSPYVDCQCQTGFRLNGTQCAYSRRELTKDSGAGLVIGMLVLGTVLAAICTGIIIWAVRRHREKAALTEMPVQVVQSPSPQKLDDLGDVGYQKSVSRLET